MNIEITPAALDAALAAFVRRAARGHSCAPDDLSWPGEPPLTRWVAHEPIDLRAAVGAALLAAAGLLPPDAGAEETPAESGRWVPHGVYRLSVDRVPLARPTAEGEAHAASLHEELSDEGFSARGSL